MQRGYPPSLVTNPPQPSADDKAALEKEAAELKRAKIQNGAHPDYQNGHPKDAEKGR